MVEFLKGRSDIPRFLLGADLLIHPAYNENTGTVLLEALVAGLPVLVTDVCGYAHYITDANCGRVVPSPSSSRRSTRCWRRCSPMTRSARPGVATRWLCRDGRSLLDAAEGRRRDSREGA